MSLRSSILSSGLQFLLKAIFHLVKISTQADFFRAENSAWKHFPRGQKKKKDIIQHYISNTTNLIM